MKLRYNKNIKRNKTLKIPERLYKKEDESIEFNLDSLNNENEKIEEKKVKKNFFNEEFSIKDIFLQQEDKLTEYDFKRSQQENINILLETEKINFILKNEWKEIFYKHNMKFYIMKCNLCKGCVDKKPILYKKNFLGTKKLHFEIYNKSSYFLVIQSNFMTVTNLIKYTNCIYEPFNISKISYFPHLTNRIENNKNRIESNKKSIENYKKMIDSALLGTCAHKIVQTSNSLNEILEEVISNILLSFNLSDNNDVKDFLLTLKKKLYPFYTIKFKDFISEKKFINKKFNLIFIIDLIFKSEIVELKNGKKNFSHILQILYYFICSGENKEPYLFYFNDLFDKIKIKKVKYDHSLIESMIIKKNIVSSINKINKEIYKCTCQFDSFCLQIDLMNEIKDLKGSFFKFLWKSIEIEETEETKKILIENYFHIKKSDILELFQDIKNEGIKENSILIFQNIDITKYQIIEIHLKGLKICKGFLLKKYKTFYFYELTQLLDFNFTEISVISDFMNKNDLLETSFIESLYEEKEKVKIEISKSTESFKIQRFGLLNSYFTGVFKEKYIKFYKDKYLNKISFNDFEEFKNFQNYKIESSIDSIDSINSDYSLDSINSIDSDYSWDEVNSIKTEEIKTNNSLFIPQKYISEYKILNINQQEALKKCLEENKENKITGIHGMPGTGKTKLLTLLLKILNYHNKRILVLTFTNKSLENIKNKISNDIKTYQTSLTLKNLKNIQNRKNLKNIENLITDFSEYLKKDTIIFTNINNLNDPIFANIKNNFFDYLIVDEAGQLPLLYFNCLYPFSKRIIAVGDHLQLKPVSSKGLIISLLQFIEPDIQISLKIQYRMSKKIMDAANLLFYNNQMEIQKAEEGKINIQKAEAGKIKIINKNEDSFYENIIKIIEKENLDEFKILTFFNKTKEEINRKKKKEISIFDKIKLKKENLIKIEAETIDRFQGSESKTIFLILDNLNNEITNCKLRLNVAITRARENLFLIGNFEFLEKNYMKMKCENLEKGFLCKEKKCKACVFKQKFCLKNDFNCSIVDVLVVLKFFS